MVKQTTQLLIKALIIGLLVNLVLQQVPVTTASPTTNPALYQNRHSLEKGGAGTSADFAEPTGN